MTYILSASPNSSEGHDPADFLRQFETACSGACAPLTRRHVQRRALLALGDPLLYYSLYGVTASYIGNGSPTGPMPLIPVGHGTHVLPSLGYALAPFGEEWIVRASLQTRAQAGRRTPRLTNVTLRVGNTGATTPWGVSARLADVLRVKALRVDARVDLWRQPDLFAEQTSDPLHAGAAATGTVVVPLPRWLRTPWSDGLHVTAGYKSEGYVPGEQLSGGLVFRAGLSLR
jgi:hypothetical protein